MHPAMRHTDEIMISVITINWIYDESNSQLKVYENNSQRVRVNKVIGK